MLKVYPHSEARLRKKFCGVFWTDSSKAISDSFVGHHIDEQNSRCVRTNVVYMILNVVGVQYLMERLRLPKEAYGDFGNLLSNLDSG